jgi:hypothetical protein
LASQLRFEGPVLEDLLDRVRSEVGTGARIVAANRIRKGGVGGFFSKEHYEVLVEPGAPGAERVPASVASTATLGGQGRARVPMNILDLAEAVNDAERDNDTIDLVDTDGTSDGERDAFAAMLDRIARETAVDNEPEVIDDEPSVLVEPGPAAPVVAAPQPAMPPRRPALATKTIDNLRERADTARTRATAARVIDEEPAPAADPVDLAALADPDAPSLPIFRRAAKSIDVIERPENALLRLGLPARLIPRGVGTREMQGALMESLARLPVPPPLPHALGVVVAVVGTGPQPVLLARDISEELDLDPDRVVLATQAPLGEGIPAWLQVCDPATAEERRRSWRRREYPTVVACSLPPGREHLRWAREMLDSFEPTSTWAIVEAGWKSEDIRHWAEVLGGIDVLALRNLAQTVSPAAVLELGIPVARLEGQPATPIAWADYLMALARL